MNSRKRRCLGAKTLANNLGWTVLGHPFSRERLLISALIAAASIEGMAQDGQNEFAFGSLQCGFQPSPLIGIYAAQDAGINGNQSEPFRLYLEKRPPLPSGTHRKFLAQSRRFRNEMLDTVFGRCRE